MPASSASSASRTPGTGPGRRSGRSSNAADLPTPVGALANRNAIRGTLPARNIRQASGFCHSDLVSLTAVCLDTLTGTDHTAGQNRAVTVAEIFVDAALAADDGGESGATLPSGVKVGPNTLAEILCGGKIRVITHDRLHPVAFSDRTDTIPPAVRRFVQWRDMGHAP